MFAGERKNYLKTSAAEGASRGVLKPPGNLGQDVGASKLERTQFCLAVFTKASSACTFAFRVRTEVNRESRLSIETQIRNCLELKDGIFTEASDEMQLLLTHQ